MSRFFDTCHALLRENIEKRVIPSAAYAIGEGRQLLRAEVLGDRALFSEPQPADADTLYDLASLSKLVVTTMVALRLVEQGRLLLSDSLVGFFTPEELAGCPEGREAVTVFHLMTHTSGITPHLPLWVRLDAPEPSTVAHTILSSPAVCAPGEQVYYSCMGYILLQILLERLTGRPLDRLAEELVFCPLGITHTRYCPTSENVVTTEFSSLHQEYIKGHVHDENAYFLGGRVRQRRCLFSARGHGAVCCHVRHTRGIAGCPGQAVPVGGDLCGGCPRLHPGACRVSRTWLPTQAAPAGAVLGGRPYVGRLLRPHRLYGNLPVGGCREQPLGCAFDQRCPSGTRQDRLLP